MKKTLCIIIFSLCLIRGNAQIPPIMVCNSSGTSCTPYLNLDTAIVNASSGSYIYVPGWSFVLNVHLNKELHIIGTGHYPDSTLVTHISQITTDIFLDQGCDNTSLEGLYIQGNILTNNGSGGCDTINNIKLLRCNFNSIYHEGYCFINNNALIKDCITRSDINPNCYNSTISNCIISGNLFQIYFTEVNNCIVLGQLGSYSNCTNDIISNNIFDSIYIANPSPPGCSGCYLTNNLTVYSSLLAYYATSETGTITNISTTNLFVNAFATGFNYSFDYHLKSTSPGHNYGDDGTDVGIYGGIPYKEGAVPSNPHFFYKNISATTDSTGNLPVHFKVRGEY